MKLYNDEHYDDPKIWENKSERKIKQLIAIYIKTYPCFPPVTTHLPASFFSRKFAFILNFLTYFREFCKPRRRPRTYYQRRRERVRRQAEREAERLELESMQVHNELSDSDSSEEEEDFDCFEDDEMEMEMEDGNSFENYEEDICLEDVNEEDD